MPNLKPKIKLQQQCTNNVTGVGNVLTKFEIPNENRLPKSQTMSCITERAKSKCRPLTLTLKKTEKYKLSLNKANQSLPESPVCEELKILKEQCRKNADRFARFAKKRRSCSYFIGLDDNEEEIDNIAKSFESLPAMNERSVENLSESSNEADEGNGNFSDDSLEGDFKNPPRRCVSEYHINIHADTNTQVEHKNYPGYSILQKRVLTQSQESILSDASVESFCKGSAEVLDCSNYENDRHSSASFFLSRRKMQEGRSQESILTDESDYQMFPLQENADHRSTESVLTDDSDSMVKSAPLEMLFDSHYKRKRQNSETYSGNPNNAQVNATSDCQQSAESSTLTRAVFRSKSLQDTRLSEVKNGISYTEENFRPNRTCIYYEFNVDDKGSAIRNSQKSEAILRNASLKVLKEPQSMLILNDIVAHKPPKPKRNFSRTQSMRNRARPAWNKYNLDTPSQQTLSLKNLPCSDNILPCSVSLGNFDYQPVDASVDCEKEETVESKVVKLTVKSPLQVLEDQGNGRKPYYGVPMRAPLCTQNESAYNSEANQSQDSFSIKEDSRERASFQNEIPTKDTFETYDSLEPNGAPPCELSSLECQEENLSKPMNKDTSFDIRITRAIEGTVKLLSKEFENLVRREQYFMKQKHFRLTQCRDTNENFAKLEAERDTRCSTSRKEFRGNSGGQDSDCADLSAIDKSLMESGSSTPASSCANSPKHVWPPASRCQMKWTKTLPTISQDILPSKHQFAGIARLR